MKHEIKRLSYNWIYKQGCPTLPVQVSFDEKSYFANLLISQIHPKMYSNDEKATSNSEISENDGIGSFQVN